MQKKKGDKKEPTNFIEHFSILSFFFFKASTPNLLMDFIDILVKFYTLYITDAADPCVQSKKFQFVLIFSKSEFRSRTQQSIDRCQWSTG